MAISAALYSVLAVALVLAISFFVSGSVLRYAVRRNLMDIPNERSSHTAPTPKGGGIAIAIAGIIGIALLWSSEMVPGWLLAGFCLPGIAIAMVGFVDDAIQVSAFVRFAVHMVACSIGLVMIPDAVQVVFPGAQAPELLLQFILVVGLAWAVNLFNFMDGIDGLASVEAVYIAAAILLLAFASGQLQSALPAAVTGAAALGFLAYNWPPARLFMGDVGSGFLGYALAFSMLAAIAEGLNIWAAITVAGAFVADSTVTLLTRLLRGKKAHQAHRTHAYQQLAQRWGSHGKVTVLFMAINLFWLLPLGFLIQVGIVPGPVAAMLGYTPLILGAISIGAGRSRT
jgi:Fuc2NAc and GlcNAc transferase